MSIIQLKDVTKAFDTTRAVSGLSFEVEPGQIVELVGPEGSGKTTTVKLLVGALAPDTGEIELFGEPVTTKAQAIKHRIGYVPEEADVMATLSAVDYLAFVAGLYGIEEKPAREKATHLLELVGLKETMNDILAHYSEAKKRQVMILASLIHNPDVIIWDEAFSGLDHQTVRFLRELLFQLKELGKTVIFVADERDRIGKISDRVIQMSHGILVIDIPVGDLTATTLLTRADSYEQERRIKEHIEQARQIIDVIVNE